MNNLEQLANQLVFQRNQALNALAESEVRFAMAQEEINKLQKRLHDLVADNATPSGASISPEVF